MARGLPLRRGGRARIPFLLDGPGVPRGEVREDLVELHDVPRTLLTLAGLPVPEGPGGLHVLEERREVLHGEHVESVLTRGTASVQWPRGRRYAYVWRSSDGHEQLFDLVQDPQELHDLAALTEGRSRLPYWRGLPARRLAGRSEGFVDGAGQLVPGRPVRVWIGGGSEPDEG